jgi:hypothetical protein
MTCKSKSQSQYSIRYLKMPRPKVILALSLIGLVGGVFLRPSLQVNAQGAGRPKGSSDSQQSKDGSRSRRDHLPAALCV